MPCQEKAGSSILKFVIAARAANQSFLLHPQNPPKNTPPPSPPFTIESKSYGHPDLNLDFDLSDSGLPHNLQAEESAIHSLRPGLARVVPRNGTSFASSACSSPGRSVPLSSSPGWMSMILSSISTAPSGRLSCSRQHNRIAPQFLYHNGRPITPEAIYNTFAAANLAQRFEKAGGIPYLVELVETVPDPIFIPHTINALANASYRRRIIRKMKAIQDIATHTHSITPADIVL